MHEHGGCGCSHGHAETETLATPADGHGQAMESMEAESCGSGCGCGSGHDSGFSAIETASIQGFLSGIYASTLDKAKLAEYFDALAAQEDSDFARPARFLGSALEALGDEASERPTGVRLLELVSGQSV